MLTNRYFIALGIPFILLLLGAMSRKLIRAQPWRREDFYLGVDLALAGISSGLIYISDVLTTKVNENGCLTPACTSFRESLDTRLLADAVYLGFALFFSCSCWRSTRTRRRTPATVERRSSRSGLPATR